MYRLSPLLGYLLAAAAAMVGLWWLLPSNDVQTRGDSLSLYCAAGMQKPIDAICKQFEEEYSVRVQVQYGGSNTLLSQLEIARQGDLYLAADDFYLNLAAEKELLAETIPLARMTVVVVVAKGNPHSIDSLDDLHRHRIAMANPDQAAIGKLTRARLSELGVWETLESSVRDRGVFKPTVTDVLTDVVLGSVDAGIVWDSVAKQSQEVEIVELEEFQPMSARIGIGVLATTDNPPLALKFARFASASDRGLKSFAKHHYEPEQGDPWQETPELTVYAGSMNRRALEPVLEEFEKREGVTINTKYNGCGILNADILSKQGGGTSKSFPDAYVPCDRMYLAKLGPMFDELSTISSSRMVIATAKDNPKNIQTLDDLIRPGIKVALGQPNQCTIGMLSKTLLRSKGVYDELVAKNLATETMTSSLLVPMVVANSVDAAIVYETDTKAEADRLEIVQIDSPLAMAKQSFGIAQQSQQKQLAQRLFKKIAASRESYEAAGFQWELEEAVE